MQYPIEILINPEARSFRQDVTLAPAVERLAKGRARVTVARRREQLEDWARSLRGHPPERVVLCGGDGSLMAGLSALHRNLGQGRLPELGIVPMGTVSTVARAWLGRVEPLEWLERILSDRSIHLDSRRSLRLVEQGGSTRVGFTFGAGLVARFFQRYERAGAGGRWQAASMVARVFLGAPVNGRLARELLAPVAMRVAVDGIESPEREFSLVVSSVLRDVGLGMKVTYRAGEDPRRLHLVASSLPPARLAPQLGRVLRGRALQGRGAVDALAGTFSVRFMQRGSYVLDGDLFDASALEVEPGPPLSVLLPAGAPTGAGTTAALLAQRGA